MNKIKTEALYKTKLDERTIILIEGIDSIDFLQNLISNNVESISNNNSIYSTLLNPQGKFLFDFMVFTKDNNKKLYLDCYKSRSEELIKQLNFYKIRKNVTFSIIENIEIIYLYGEYDALLSKLKLKNKEGYTSIINNIIFIMDPRNKKLGIRLYNFKNNLPNYIYTIQTKPIEEYEKLRINLTVPSGIKDLEIGKSFLLENNFEFLNAIDFGKGCYIGQENTARQKYRATQKKMLYKIKITGKKLNIGEKIILNNRQVGQIKSSIKGLGLASIRKDIYEEYKLKNMEINVQESKIKFIN